MSQIAGTRKSTATRTPTTQHRTAPPTLTEVQTQLATATREAKDARAANVDLEAKLEVARDEWRRMNAHIRELTNDVALLTSVIESHLPTEDEADERVAESMLG